MVDTAALRSQISAGRSQIASARTATQAQRITPLTTQQLRKQTPLSGVRRKGTVRKFQTSKEKQLAEIAKQEAVFEKSARETESQIAAYEAAQREASLWAAAKSLVQRRGAAAAYIAKGSDISSKVKQLLSARDIGGMGEEAFLAQQAGAGQTLGTRTVAEAETARKAAEATKGLANIESSTMSTLLDQLGVTGETARPQSLSAGAWETLQKRAEGYRETSKGTYVKDTTITPEQTAGFKQILLTQGSVGALEQARRNIESSRWEGPGVLPYKEKKWEYVKPDGTTAWKDEPMRGGKWERREVWVVPKSGGTQTQAEFEKQKQSKLDILSQIEQGKVQSVQLPGKERLASIGEAVSKVPLISIGSPILPGASLTLGQTWRLGKAGVSAASRTVIEGIKTIAPKIAPIPLLSIGSPSKPVVGLTFGQTYSSGKKIAVVGGAGIVSAFNFLASTSDASRKIAAAKVAGSSLFVSPSDIVLAKQQKVIVEPYEELVGPTLQKALVRQNIEQGLLYRGDINTEVQQAFDKKYSDKIKKKEITFTEAQKEFEKSSTLKNIQKKYSEQIGRDTSVKQAAKQIGLSAASMLPKKYSRLETGIALGAGAYFGATALAPAATAGVLKTAETIFTIGAIPQVPKIFNKELPMVSRVGAGLYVGAVATGLVGKGIRYGKQTVFGAYKELPMGTLTVEGKTALRAAAKKANMTVKQYISAGRDPFVTKRWRTWLGTKGPVGSGEYRVKSLYQASKAPRYSTRQVTKVEKLLARQGLSPNQIGRITGKGTFKRGFFMEEQALTAKGITKARTIGQAVSLEGKDTIVSLGKKAEVILQKFPEPLTAAMKGEKVQAILKTPGIAKTTGANLYSVKPATTTFGKSVWYADKARVPWGFKGVSTLSKKPITILEAVTGTSVVGETYSLKAGQEVSVTKSGKIIPLEKTSNKYIAIGEKGKERFAVFRQTTKKGYKVDLFNPESQIKKVYKGKLPGELKRDIETTWFKSPESLRFERFQDVAQAARPGTPIAVKKVGGLQKTTESLIVRSKQVKDTVLKTKYKTGNQFFATEGEPVKRGIVQRVQKSEIVQKMVGRQELVTAPDITVTYPKRFNMLLDKRAVLAPPKMEPITTIKTTKVKPTTKINLQETQFGYLKPTIAPPVTFRATPGIAKVPQIESTLSTGTLVAPSTLLIPQTRFASMELDLQKRQEQLKERLVLKTIEPLRPIESIRQPQIEIIQQPQIMKIQQRPLQVQREAQVLTPVTTTAIITTTPQVTITPPKVPVPKIVYYRRQPQPQPRKVQIVKPTKPKPTAYAVDVRLKGGVWSQVIAGVTKKEARAIGMLETRKTAVASFRERKVTGRARKQKIQAPAWMKVLYRPSKIEKDVTVQKRGLRILTSGEKKAISYMGGLAMKKKGKVKKNGKGRKKK